MPRSAWQSADIGRSNRLRGPFDRTAPASGDSAEPENLAERLLPPANKGAGADLGVPALDSRMPAGGRVRGHRPVRNNLPGLQPPTDRQYAADHPARRAEDFHAVALHNFGGRRSLHAGCSRISPAESRCWRIAATGRTDEVWLAEAFVHQGGSFARSR